MHSSDPTAQPVPLELQVSLLRAQLALQRRETSKRARGAFTAGLVTGSVLAAVVGVGLGYALGVRAKLIVPANTRTKPEEDT